MPHDRLIERLNTLAAEALARAGKAVSDEEREDALADWRALDSGAMALTILPVVNGK